jgi:hypothetical protein
MTAVVLYILSVGPVIGIADRGMIAPETIEWIYAPLEPLAEVSPMFRDALIDYVNLWEPSHVSSSP